jgi:hypothetical protein
MTSCNQAWTSPSHKTLTKPTNSPAVLAVTQPRLRREVRSAQSHSASEKTRVAKARACNRLTSKLWKGPRQARLDRWNRSRHKYRGVAVNGEIDETHGPATSRASKRRRFDCVSPLIGSFGRGASAGGASHTCAGRPLRAPCRCEHAGWPEASPEMEGRAIGSAVVSPPALGQRSERTGQRVGVVPCPALPWARPGPDSRFATSAWWRLTRDRVLNAGRTRTATSRAHRRFRARTAANPVTPLRWRTEYFAI